MTAMQEGRANAFGHVLMVRYISACAIPLARHMSVNSATVG